MAKNIANDPTVVDNSVARGVALEANLAIDDGSTAGADGAAFVLGQSELAPIPDESGGLPLRASVSGGSAAPSYPGDQRPDGYRDGSSDQNVGSGGVAMDITGNSSLVDAMGPGGAGNVVAAAGPPADDSSSGAAATAERVGSADGAASPAADETAAPAAVSDGRILESGGAISNAVAALAASAGTGLIINLVYDTQALAAPQSFRDGMQAAANLLEAAITDNITINIGVGYGEYNGGALPNQNTSEGNFAYQGVNGQGINITYSNLRADLAVGTSAVDVISVNALPNTTSLQSTTNFLIGSAEAKVFGLLTPTDSSLDGLIGMGTKFTGSTLIGGALHEITHAMARVPGASALSLFRYTGVGAHDFDSNKPTAASYFSIDGGVTKLADFGTSSDPSDFLNSPGSTLTSNDSFNETIAGSVLTSVDLAMMDVLGFKIAPTNFTVSGGTVDSSTEIIYSGEQLLVNSGGTSTNTYVLNGGVQILSAGGVDQQAIIGSGGTQDVFGTASAAVVSGGTQRIEAGGKSFATFLTGSGAATVSSGGSAVGTLVTSGGNQTVNSGGTAVFTTISGGATETVLAGGTTVSPTISGTGAILNLQNGAVVTSGITFEGVGGQLKIGGSTLPSNTISGFVTGDFLDLTGITFDGHGTTKIVTSGGVQNQLQITEGGVTYTMQLNPAESFAGHRFEINPDGSGGSLLNLVSTTMTFAAEVDFTFDPNWNDYLVVHTPSTTTYISNWLPDGAFPTANDDLTITNNVACILSGQEFDGNSTFTDAADSLTITAGASLTINSELDLGNGATNGGVALNNAGPITDHHILSVGGNVHNTSALNLQSDGGNYFNFALLEFGGTNVQLDGGGTIAMLPAGNNANEITGASSIVTTLHNVNNTITGVGAIGQGGVNPAEEPHNLLNLDNQAAGVVNAGAGGALLLSTPTITNAGTLEATAGGGLTIRAATVTQTGTGFVLATGANSHVDLNGVTITGGLLTTAAGGVINAVAGTTDVLDSTTAFGAVTNAGTLANHTQAVLELRGSIHNTGTVVLQSEGGNYFNFSLLRVGTAGATLGGGGNVLLLPGGNSANQIVGNSTASNVVLVNADNTISGSGGIGQGAVNPAEEPHAKLSLVNQAAGLVEAGAGNSLLLGTLSVSNAGTLEAATGGVLTLRGSTITQTGTGVILAAGTGSHVDLNGVTITGGLLSTAAGGVINGVAGTTNVLDSGTAYGAITNAGVLVNQDSAVLELRGSIHNTGTIVLQTGGGNYFNRSFLRVGAGGATLGGGGNVLLQPGGNSANEIVGNSTTSGVVLVNADNTISGSGGIGQGAVNPAVEPHAKLTFVNQAAGLVKAGAGNSFLLGALTVTNAGTLEAAAGGVLTIQGSTITQTGTGVVLATDIGSHVDLNGVTIDGGLLSTASGGVFNAIAGTTNILDSGTNYGTVTNAGTLLNQDSAVLELRGSIHNTGTVVLQTGGGNYFNRSFLRIGAGGATLNGGGNVLLQPVGNSANQIIGNDTAANTVLVNVDNTISGAGGIGQGGVNAAVEPHAKLSFVNQAAGLVNAIGGNIVLGALTVSNAGMLQASAGSGLLIGSGTTITQTGNGVVLATGTASHVDLNNATIAGGRLSTATGGVIQTTGGTDIIDGSTSYGAVTNTGSIFVGNVVPLTLQGTIHNNGTIALQSGGGNYFNFSLLQIGTVGAVLDGAGSIVLQAGGNNANQITGASTSVAATLQSTGTITGTGAIGQGALNPAVEPHDELVFLNLAGGLVDANSAGATLRINTGAPVTNSGTLQATAGTLVVDDTLTNLAGSSIVDAKAGGTVVLNGIVSNSSLLEADGGTLVATGTVMGPGNVLIANGGTADLTGNFQQDVTFSGAGTLALPEIAVTGNGFNGRIVGMGAGDVLDIPGLPFKSSYDEVVLRGSGGAEGLFVRDTAVADTAGNPQTVAQVLTSDQNVSRNFVLADDGHGGTKLTWQAAGPVPAPTGLALAAASDTAPQGDNATNIKTPVITGKGEVGDNVILFDGATSIGGATVKLDGTWSVTTSALSGGLHHLTATETDPLGNTSAASAAFSLTILPAASPAVLNNFSWTEGWGSPNNPRLTADVNGDGTTDYLGFGFNAVFIGYGGTFAGSDPSQTGPGFSAAGLAVQDFGTNEGYTAVVQRGAAATGAGVGDVLYGQGFKGLYWYAATGVTPQTDAAGNTYNVLNYQTSPNFYGNFGTSLDPNDAQGWTPANGFQILKSTASDQFASILGFGDGGIVVGPQAFAPGATAASTYTLDFQGGNSPTTNAGNNFGWNAQNDIRTFTDAGGNTIDLNHDGIADFVGMGPNGLSFAFGNDNGPGGRYQLGPLQSAQINGTADDLGDAQGWNNATTLRYVVADPQTGFYDILAFGDFGVVVAPGQDPATHNGQPFGQLYLAMPDFGSNQGWSVSQTPRIVGDVNGDGIPDIVGFGANNTFAAIGSRDAAGNLHFALDPNLTLGDFGYNEGWSGSDPQTVRTLGTFKTGGTSHADLILSGGGTNFGGVETQVFRYI